MSDVELGLEGELALGNVSQKVNVHTGADPHGVYCPVGLDSVGSFPHVVVIHETIENFGELDFLFSILAIN